MKRKFIMTGMLTGSLLTMFWPWFGGTRGVQTISGLILLENPIALTCMILAYIGIWSDYGKNSEILGMIGLLGIAVMEIYEFFTWHIITITGHFDLRLSIEWCYPEFYIALFSMIMTLLIYKKYFRHFIG